MRSSSPRCRIPFPFLLVTRTMSRRRRTKDDPSRLAADRGAEDGGDPREFHARPWNAPRQARRKGRQLCGQIQDALLIALASSADEVLQNLTLVSVESAPHTGRLRVRVGAENRAMARAALARATGYLRCEVAAVICRRAVPELVFEVVD